MKGDQGKSIIDQTFTEIVIVLLFTSFIIYISVQQTLIFLLERSSQNIVASLPTNVAECARIPELGGGKVFPVFSEASSNIESIYLQVNESNTLSRISRADHSCISKLCEGVFVALYESRSFINQVRIEGYASPTYSSQGGQSVSLLGRECQTHQECNVIFSARRASNVYQICAAATMNYSEELGRWYSETVFPIGLGVPNESWRYRNVEFEIEFLDFWDVVEFGSQ